MPVSNPRTRLISFRVSEHEYARLRTLSNTQGAHSLADFVRVTVCWAMDNAQQECEARSNGCPAVGDFRPQSAYLGLAAGQTRLTYDGLAGLLLALQWKAESLDQEVRHLTSLLKTVDPAARNGIPGGHLQVTTPLEDPASGLHEVGRGVLR
jgi:hypothetical protein